MISVLIALMVFEYLFEPCKDGAHLWNAVEESVDGVREKKRQIIISKCKKIRRQIIISKCNLSRML